MGVGGEGREGIFRQCRSVAHCILIELLLRTCKAIKVLRELNKADAKLKERFVG